MPKLWSVSINPDSWLLHESSSIIDRYKGRGVSLYRLWRTELVDSFLACLTLLKINSEYIERAALVVVVSVCSVWCLIFDPESCWLKPRVKVVQHPSGNQSNEENFLNISLRNTSAACARCRASLLWSQAFFRADQMYFWNMRRVSLPSEWALNSGS